MILHPRNRPVPHWDTREYYYNNRWYDMDDRDQMRQLKKEEEAERQREHAEADWLYDTRR